MFETIIDKTQYHVIRDTREQKGWLFDVTAECNGMSVCKLDTGDYSLKGMEKIFTIERKGSTSEFSQNVVEKRFERELERLDEFKYPFLICEFTLQDIMDFPKNSGIPPYKWKKLRIRPRFLMKKLIEYLVNHKTTIIMAGHNGKNTAKEIFRQMNEIRNR